MPASRLELQSYAIVHGPNERGEWFAARRGAAADGSAFITCRASRIKASSCAHPCSSYAMLSPSGIAGAELSNLDGCELRGGTFGRDRDRLFARLAVEQEEAADHFLRLGERTVDRDRLAVALLHANALLVAAQRLTDLQDAARFETLAEFQHAVIQ